MQKLEKNVSSEVYPTSVRTARMGSIWITTGSLTAQCRWVPWKPHLAIWPGSWGSLYPGLRLCCRHRRTRSHPPSTSPSETSLGEVKLRSLCGAWGIRVPIPALKVSWARTVSTPGATTSPRLVQRCEVSLERKTRRRKDCIQQDRTASIWNRTW